MGVQITYGARGDRYAGQPAEDVIRGRVLPRSLESATLDFGVVVSQGTLDNQCVVGGAAPIGVAMRNPSRPMRVGDDGQYVVGDTVDVLDGDFIYVTTADTSGAFGDPLNYVIATGAIGIGAAGGGEAALPGYLAQTVSGAGIVKIFVDAHFSTMIGAVLAAGLAVAVPPHAATHEDAGTDEIAVGGLAGVLLEGQNADHIDGIVVHAAGATNGQILKSNGTTFELAADEVGT